MKSIINRYYDPTTDQFISIDPALVQTNEPYIYSGDNPLNATDPLGLSKATTALANAGLALGAREAAATLNPSAANLAAVSALKNRVISDMKIVQHQAISQYISAVSDGSHSGSGIITVCGNLAIVQVCTSETSSGKTYYAVGVGIGFPGVSMSAGNAKGQSADNSQLGWSTCVDGALLFGAQKCWANKGNGSSKSVEMSSISGGVWVMFGRKLN